MNAQYFLSFYILLLTICFLPSCASLVEKSGEALDGSAFEEKTLAIYRTAKKDPGGSPPGGGVEIRKVQNRLGVYSVVITLNKFPSIKIRGTLPDEQGEFSIVSLDYLGGSPQGWNEYSLDLAGQGNLVLGETTAILSINSPIETGQIFWGRIRRYDTRITGNEAVTGLQGRHERLLSLAEWMNAREDTPAILIRKDFEQYWKPILFPELVSRRQKPHGWQQESDEWVTAEDIRWNTGYTERVFPEELWRIRNSGAMLRDWEEALEWMYNEYEWERLISQFSQETILSKVRH
ncbi:MAG: hypothetical protein FWG89_11310 [Treponema sp.]|nr:hypothetical protein [Treponema sp.]